MNTEVKEQVDAIISQARKNLEQDGELAPVFFVHTPKGLAVLITPFENDFQKQLVVMQVKVFAKEHKADWILFVTEGWMVKAKEGEADSVGRPSEHPDRVEGVIFSFEAKGEESTMAVVEQTLYTDGHKSFGEVKFEESMTGGTFSNLLGR